MRALSNQCLFCYSGLGITKAVFVNAKYLTWYPNQLGDSCELVIHIQLCLGSFLILFHYLHPNCNYLNAIDVD